MASGRIGLERLTAFRQEIRNILGENCPFKDPSEVWKYITENIKTIPSQDYNTIFTGPAACLKLREGSEDSKNILFVAICRTYLMPAGLDRTNGKARYYDGKEFIYADETLRGSGTLKLRYEDEKLPSYFEQYTLERELPDGTFDTVYCEGFFREKERDLTISLVPGIYRIVTCTRTRTGNVIGRKSLFKVESGKEICVSLTCREEMLESLKVDKSLKGVDSDILKKYAGDGYTAFMVLKTGAEPTEHVLNELAEMRSMGGTLNAKLVFILKDKKDAEDKTFKRVCDMLEHETVFDENGSFADELIKKTETLFTSLPFIMVTEGAEKAVFSDTGYKVGIVDMISRVTA